MLLKTVAVPVYTEAMCAIPYTPGLEENFQFMGKYSEEKTDVSVKRGPYLLVPRGCVPSYGEDDRRSWGSAVAIDCKMKPRDADQAQFIAKSVALLKQDVSHVGEAPTGFGKTACGIMIAAQIARTTLIVVTKQDLMDGWLKNLIQAGVPYDKIGFVQQNKCDFEGKWFVITMVQSFIKRDKYPAALYSWAGLTIFDETHRMAADSFSIACQLSNSALRLGLSATPKRKDGKTPVINAHIGKVMVVGTTC